MCMYCAVEGVVVSFLGLLAILLSHSELSRIEVIDVALNGPCSRSDGALKRH